MNGLIKKTLSIFFVLLFLLIPLVFPSKLYAACSAPVCFLGHCMCHTTGHPVICLNPTSPPTINMCCDDSSECPSGTAPPGAGWTYVTGWDCNTPDGTLGVDTALGCLGTGDVSVFVGQILSWGAGIAMVTALFIISFGGFTVMTASGDPKKVKAGQELIVSAIAGVVLIILSVIVLNFLGVNILGLAGLGF